MARKPFFGRQRELETINRLWQSDEAELLILYGRRRIGKTRLLTHWIETDQPWALYWTAEPTSAIEQLRSFSRAIFQTGNRRSQPPDQFSYGNWRTAFEELAHLAETQRLAVIIDEFTYLLEVEPGIAGILQNVWDQLLKDSNLMLVLSGSHLGMMQRQVLSYQAPLYGRCTANLLLQPLPFGITGQFFPNYDPAERVAVYAMLGGIPAYWERFKPGRSVSENMRSELLDYSASLHDEPRLLLSDFLKDPHNYVAILQAIACGASTPKDIASAAGLDERQIPQYVHILNETGFVARQIPVTKVQGTRSGRHVITDPFLRFYYRFLARRQSQLALGADVQALEEIKRHLLDFIGTYTWEELCREWLLRASARNNRLPFIPDQVGSAWTRKAQVDVAGISSMEKTLILGECKWSPHAIGSDVLQDLVQKTAEIAPSEGNWRIYYMGFARGGWKETAIHFKQAFASHPPAGDNWQGVGIELLDLQQIDADLTHWS